jgi:hypothetical protein
MRKLLATSLFTFAHDRRLGTIKHGHGCDGYSRISVRNDPSHPCRSVVDFRKKAREAKRQKC